MSTSDTGGHPREVAYRRGCTFDKGNPHGPLCTNPAVLHIVHIEDGELIPYLTCHKHERFIMPGAADFHTVGECCGEPGALWQFRHFQGDGFCFQDADEQRFHEELAEPTVATVPVDMQAEELPA